MSLALGAGATVPRTRPRRTLSQRRLAPYLFLAPGAVLFVIYVLAPILVSFWISLLDWDGVGAAKFVGLDNYRELLDDSAFTVSLTNNLLWLVFYLLALPIGLGVAIYLNQSVFGIRIIKSLFFFPFVISQVVVGLVFSWFYAPGFGLLYKLTGVAILADQNLATYGVIAAGLWPQIAYCMILFLTGLNTISSEQIEAARIDGARGLTMLRHVILPQLRAASFIALVVTVIGALRSFDLVSIMTSGGPFGNTRVLSYYMYEEALSEYGYRMGYGAAIAVVLFVIMMLFIAFFVTRLVREEKDA